MNKVVWGDLDNDEWKSAMASMGQPAYRAGQIYRAIAQGLRPEEMTDIPKSLREELRGIYEEPPSIVEVYPSKDGSSKLLYRLYDDHLVEGVYMPHRYGVSLCVSTQVGCRMGCAFCASGIGGLVRDLSAGEMLGQVTAVNRRFPGGRVSNLVLMGSGEPLDNFDQVVKFLAVVTDPNGLDLSRRNISLSTCGLPDRIRELADRDPGVTLSISLHATTDEIRRELMPIARTYSIAQVVDAARYYFQKTGRRIIYEYSMIKGKNIHFLDAKRLRELTRGYPAHVNLIMLNPVPEKHLDGCTRREAEMFLQRLKDMGVSATLRVSMGSDVAGACGQLRAKFSAGHGRERNEDEGST